MKNDCFPNTILLEMVIENVFSSYKCVKCLCENILLGFICNYSKIRPQQATTRNRILNCLYPYGHTHQKFVQKHLINYSDDNKN